MDNELTGLIIGRYQIIRLLGRGGFGVTYLAFDKVLQRECAVKEYLPSDFSIRDGDVRARSGREETFQWGKERFLEEARVLARFSSASIVRVVEIFESSNTAYMVLEYERGNSLKEWRKKLSRIPLQSELDTIFFGLTGALQLIRSNGLLHRDISPDNVIVRPNGSVVLLDFGSARELYLQKSHTISAIVKAGYSPPEQYSSRSTSQGAWSDIYALGATLYYAVTGVSPQEATERLLSDQLVELSADKYRALRPRFLTVINNSLALSPAARPQLSEIVALVANDHNDTFPTVRVEPNANVASDRVSSDMRNKKYGGISPGYLLSILVACVVVAIVAFFILNGALNYFYPSAIFQNDYSLSGDESAIELEERANSCWKRVKEIYPEFAELLKGSSNRNADRLRAEEYRQFAEFRKSILFCRKISLRELELTRSYDVVVAQQRYYDANDIAFEQLSQRRMTWGGAAASIKKSTLDLKSALGTAE